MGLHLRDCTCVRGASGLLLPKSVSPLPPDFALTFDRVTRRSVAVWQRPGRMGVRFEPT
jgi:hypothetical protein